MGNSENGHGLALSSPKRQQLLQSVNNINLEKRGASLSAHKQGKRKRRESWSDDDDSVVGVDVEDGGNERKVGVGEGAVEKHGREKGESLEQFCNRLCPKQPKVILYEMNFKEIQVTIPSKGFREVYYTAMASDTESDDESSSEDEEDNDDTNNRSTKRQRCDKPRYEDWRLQTIRAFPSSSSTSKSDKTDPETSKENEKYFIMEIPSSHDFIFKVGKAEDDLHTILDILAGGKMSTHIIDGYLTLRIQKYYKDFQENLNRRMLLHQKSATNANNYKFRKNKNSSNKPLQPQQETPINFQYLSVNFIPIKDRDDPVSKFVPNMKYLPDLDKFGKNSDAQLIAPLYASNHLYLALFDFREKTVNAYDSSWHYLPMPLREGQIQVILQAITSDPSQDASKWKINFVQTSCPQYDEYSCGIYAIYYAENVLRGIAHHKNRWKLSDKRVMQIRRQIVKELLQTTINGRRFLQAISD